MALVDQRVKIRSGLYVPLRRVLQLLLDHLLHLRSLKPGQDLEEQC